MARKKKVIEEKSQEQLEQERLERELSEIREHYYCIPEPSYIHNIGDKVRIGVLKDCIIEEILDEGKIYKIDFTDIDHNYGKPIIKKHQKRYYNWLSIRKFNENKESFVKNRDLRLNYMQMALNSLLNKVYFFGVDFEPEYQRDYVWDLNDKVDLIDSIYNHVDIGKFVFINRGATKPYEILDGKQRLRTICDFYEDKFQYKGKYFSDLSIRDQDHFTNYTVNVAEVENMSKEQTLRYFLMLNTGGKSMSKEQLDKVRKMLDE